MKDGHTFESLARSILSQQLATSAARTIYGRFQTACKVIPLHWWNVCFFCFCTRRSSAGFKRHFDFVKQRQRLFVKQRQLQQAETATSS